MYETLWNIIVIRSCLQNTPVFFGAFVFAMPPHPLDPRWASPPLLNPQLVQPCQWAPFPPAGQTQSLGWTQVLHQSTRRYIHRLHLPTLDGAQTRFVSWLLWSLAGTSMNLREIARKKTHNLFQVECDGVCIDEIDKCGSAWAICSCFVCYTIVRGKPIP